MTVRILITLWAVFAAPLSWAGHVGYGYDYQHAHQQLLTSSHHLSEQARDFYHYAQRYIYSSSVRNASKRLYKASNELYYLIKRDADDHQLQQEYQYTRRAYYELRGQLQQHSAAASVFDQVGYALHDVENNYQHYQRTQAVHSRRHQHNNSYGSSYRSNRHGSGISLHFRLR